VNDRSIVSRHHIFSGAVTLFTMMLTVIVPDLRGAGDSSRPESGYDKMTPVLNPDP